MEIRWSEAAKEDLLGIHSFIAKNNPGAAERVGRKIVSLVLRLPEHPRRGRPGRVGGTRELMVSGTPYVVVYAIGEDVIAIVRVLHGARRWPPG